MKTCGTIYKSSRENANYTQEQASDFLHIGLRTLVGYEAGTATVPDDVVDRMMQLYQDELLGYRHLLTNPIARKFLPDIETRTSLSQAALNLMCKSGAYMAAQVNMMEVAADGKIGAAEKETWDKVTAAVDNLIAAAFILRFHKED